MPEMISRTWLQVLQRLSFIGHADQKSLVVSTAKFGSSCKRIGSAFSPHPRDQLEMDPLWDYFFRPVFALILFCSIFLRRLANFVAGCRTIRRPFSTISVSPSARRRKYDFLLTTLLDRTTSFTES